MAELTHFDRSGAAHMVDISAKPSTARTAIATGMVHMKPETLQKIREGSSKKGDVLGIARIAGIMGAKRTADIIPLCHPLPLSKITIDFDIETDSDTVHITATAKTTGQTGVEMEALTAVSVAGLTIYDMCKAVDKAMMIDGIRLTYKEGGASGCYEAP